jgi:hypothetical protein
MRKRIRLTVLACAAALALAVTAIAAADYTPSMGIFQANYKPGGGGSVTIVVAQTPANDATARIAIYVPPAYTTTLGQSPGATIGSVLARVQLLQTGSTNVFTLRGAIKVENPTTYASVAPQCTQSPTPPEATWSLNASVSGQTIAIPIFVSHTAGAEAAFSSAKLIVCFRNPALPQPQGSGGTKFVDAALTIQSGVFRNPGAAGNPLWRSIFTPWAGSNPVPNAAGTTEAEGVVPMPHSLTLKRVRTRRGFFRVAGTLVVAGSRPAGQKVELWGGVRGKGGTNFKRLATTKTKRGGKFAFTRRLPKKTTLVFAEHPPDVFNCATVKVVPLCTAMIQSNAISGSLKVSPAKKKRRR